MLWLTRIQSVLTHSEYCHCCGISFALESLDPSPMILATGMAEVLWLPPGIKEADSGWLALSGRNFDQFGHFLKDHLLKLY